MRKQLALLATLGVVLGLFAACSVSTSSAPSAISDISNPEVASAAEAASANIEELNTGVVDPLAQYDTVEDAQADLGFSVKTPAWLPEGYEQTLVQTIDNKILEVTYTNGGGNVIVYRMARGDEDISGDYTDYPVDVVIDTGSVQGNMRGQAEDSYNLVTFTSLNEDETYSIYFEVPVDQATLVQVVESL